MTHTKTMAMKARVANAIRTALYKKPIDIPDTEKLELFEKIYNLNRDMHWELIAYKNKRKAKAKLHKERLVAPQTKSMKKKLGLIKKTPLIKTN
jgi:hypothetical protein